MIFNPEHLFNKKKTLGLVLYNQAHENITHVVCSVLACDLSPLLWPVLGGLMHLLPGKPLPWQIHTQLILTWVCFFFFPFFLYSFLPTLSPHFQAHIDIYLVGPLGREYQCLLG